MRCLPLNMLIIRHAFLRPNLQVKHEGKPTACQTDSNGSLSASSYTQLPKACPHAQNPGDNLGTSLENLCSD